MAEKITLGEIKEIIKAENVSPSDLFAIEDLITDASVKGYVESAVKETQNKLRGEAEQRRRGEEGLDKKGKEWEDEKKEKDEEIKKLQIAGAKRDAIDLFATKIKERKLNKQQTSYITKKQKDFEPKEIDNVDREVDKFMDSSLEEYKEDAKIFGHKTEETKEEPKGGGEPGEGGLSEDDELIPD